MNTNYICNLTFQYGPLLNGEPLIGPLLEGRDRRALCCAPRNVRKPPRNGGTLPGSVGGTPRVLPGGLPPRLATLAAPLGGAGGKDEEEVG